MGEPYVDEPIGRISIYHSSKNVSPRTSWPNSLPSSPTHKPLIHLEINLLLTKVPYLILHPRFKRSTKGFSPSLYCLTGWKRGLEETGEKKCLLRHDTFFKVQTSTLCYCFFFLDHFFLLFRWGGGDGNFNCGRDGSVCRQREIQWLRLR